MDKKFEILKKYYGYDSFRPGQESAIDAMLAGRDVFAVMPTGAGKSICYQIPALMSDGISIVISPLVSLMKDQVTALVQMGVKAAYINSSLTARQFSVVMQRARDGWYKIIYVAPERLLTPSFQNFVQGVKISYVTVDEAHCVSKWGQDFRPSYLDIQPFINSLRERPVVSAFTATATKVVRSDVVNLLGLIDNKTIVTGFDRKNLYYDVRRPVNRRAEVLRIVKDFDGKSGIVYCSTRKNVEEVCDFLLAEGVLATRYHAGLDDDERARNQEDFISDRRSVIVATNAFGMGIDKSNVSYVIHYNMPGDMESYYQEAGRAGRDGEPAQCILLYAAQDVHTQKFFIEHMGENSTLEPRELAELQKLAYKRLNAVVAYCETTECLRAEILRYFGEDAPPRCENCGNCQRVFLPTDITIAAQKILSCVVRGKERWGQSVIISILRGSKAEKIVQNGLDKLTTWGIMKDTPRQQIQHIISYLLRERYLRTEGFEYPVLARGERAAEVLHDRKKIIAPLPPLENSAARKEDSRKRAMNMNTSSRPSLYEHLRALRLEIAKERDVAAFVIFSNATLSDMCEKLPQTIDEFLDVSGIGQKKADEFGERFVDAINEWIAQGNA